MAPLGIVSSPVQLSLLPLFAQLTRLDESRSLRDCVQQGLLLSMALTLSMTAVMIPLACPIVRFAFERRAFGASESGLVSSLLICYISGEACALVFLLVLIFPFMLFSTLLILTCPSCALIWREMEMVSAFCSGFGLFSSLA